MPIAINMRRQKDVYVYLFFGFLESGKTTLIQDTIQSEEFNNGKKTLLIACEEGIEEYDTNILARCKTVLEVMEDKSQLTGDYFKALQEKHQPDRVIIEYNGMWLPDELFDLDMPKTWIPVQAVVAVNSQTYELYMNNMRSIMMEHFKVCDTIIFNRCFKEMNRTAIRRTIKANNRAATILYDSTDVEFDENSEEELPYDLNADIIDINEDDYGIFYLDARDFPERYKGKIVRFKAMVHKLPRLGKTYFVPGRHIMNCCPEDITFFGFVATSPMAAGLREKEWITITARVEYEYCKAYKGEGPVLYSQSIGGAVAPEDPVVYFS